MSIILKGIDLPKEGEHIVAVIKSNGKCTYWKQDTEYGICEPMQTVEAIPIPTPHGRLIEEHYPGELQAKQPEGLFVMYRSADKDTDRFILEAEE